MFNLNHQVYNDLIDRWTKKSFQQQPYVSVNAEINADNCKRLGCTSNFPSKPRAITISAMADSDYQGCLAGIKVAHRLRLNERNIIPVTF